jgi:hypothetical protein
MAEYDGRIAQLLREVAGEMPVDPELERRTLRRSRRRRALNAGAGVALAAVLVLGSVAGLRIVGTGEPNVPAHPTGPADTTSASPDALPDAVEATRDRILDAVAAGDFEALGDLIDPMTFAYNFSDGSNPIPEWSQDPSVLEPIPQLFEMPFFVTEPIEAPDGFLGEFYQWPYLMEPGSIEDVTDGERADLHTLGLTDADIEQMQQSGSYLGPRVVIRADGLWTAYVTGGD